nr:uncharacterized protein LOC123494057 [Aegilops tauschii subsp. strangulata]
MLLREFLMLRVAPLQARARPLWRLGDEEDKEYPPSAFTPLFHRKDWEPIVVSRPTFDARGLVPPVLSGAPTAPKPVELSSNESCGGKEEEEDSEATPKEMGENSPLSKVDILRALPDDIEVDACQEEGELPVVPTRSRSSLIPRDAASALTPPGAASGPSAAPSSAPGVRAPTPQASRLSGFKLPKWMVEYAAVDQPAPSAKKRKEYTAVAPPSAEKGGGSTRTSPARLPSRGQGEHRREDSAPVAPLAPKVPAPGSADEVPKAQESLISQALVTTSIPPSAAPLLPGSSASSIALERVLSEMAQLREDLLGADPHLVAGRLELASGWLHSDSVVRAALSQAAASSEKEKQSAIKAAADRDAALKAAEAARGSCQELEDELKRLRDQHTEEARGRQVKEEEMRAREDAIKNRDTELEELEKTQATERNRLEELEREAKAKEADLDAKAKVLAEDRTTFTDLEERSRAALKTLYENDLERPHPHLRDPSACLDELLEPVADEHCTAAATAVQGQVEALLKKFRGFASAPLTGGDTTKGGMPPSGIDGVQG